jgi:flotillin
MNNAAERLLGLDDVAIAHQARDIILGQMRLVITTLSFEEINQYREKFLALVNKNVNFELNKIGLEMINVNIRDITDESGYIEALGREAAAEAVNNARVEVAIADREGSIGSSTAQREIDVQVAQQNSQSATGQKQAERDQRIEVAKLEAEAHQRVEIAELEAAAIKGENESKAKMADYNSALAEREADARRRGDVALANSKRDVLLAQKEEEIALLEKQQVA